MSDVAQAIVIASKAHAGQFDKAGKPYILHPLRLMFKFESEEEMIAAVLHDVVEDSAYTLADLKNHGVPDSVLKALDCLTKKEGEDYEAFVHRVMQNDLARKVKIEDLKDNLDLTRLNTVTEKDLARVRM